MLVIQLDQLLSSAVSAVNVRVCLMLLVGIAHSVLLASTTLLQKLVVVIVAAA